MTIQTHSQIVYVPEHSGIVGSVLGALFGLAMVCCGLAFFMFADAELFADFPNWVRHLSGICFILVGSGVLFAILNGAETELEILPNERKLIIHQTTRFTGTSEKHIFFSDILEVELSKKVEALADHPRDYTNFVLNVSVLFNDPASGKHKREYVYVGPADKAEECETSIRNAMNTSGRKSQMFGSSK
jgi:hypothetical protein